VKLDIRGVCFAYGSVPVLENVTVHVNSGEIMALAGPNGSGKTTLLRCVNRIIKPKSGIITVGENDISRAGLKELALYLGYVPQSSPASFPLTVFETVLLGRKPHVKWKLGERDKEVAFKVLKLMQLDHMALRPFNELSGGEKQKVLIARAICQEPKVLVLDEPTSNLDLRHQLEVLILISKLVKDTGMSVVMAMHDLNLVSRFAVTTALLKDGRLYAAGSPGQVFTPDNIREVYGIEVEVILKSGRPFVFPLSPI
jgi:iron complex transport system ATP-binding protein